MSMTAEVDIQLPDVRLEFDADKLHDFARRVCETVKSYDAYSARVYALLRDPSSLGLSAADAALTIAVIEHALGRSDAVLSTLDRATDGGLKHYLAGRAHFSLGHYGAAIEAYRKAASAGWSEANADLLIAEAMLATGQIEAAKTLIDKHAAKHAGDAFLTYLQGWHLSLVGEVQQAIDQLEAALEKRPEDKPTLFRLAYLYDMQGQEDRAIELYEHCNATPPVHVNALVNLAVLFEDDDEYDAAEDCLEQVLAAHPNHFRAIEFLRDVEAANYMFYDEDQERVREKHNALLDIPVTDFELSVRSRNCLKKMNIHTLGDLLNTSEQQLLSYKNFGETSLNEIRAMLAQKGLRLGQALEAAKSPLPSSFDIDLSPSVPPTVFDKPVSEIELSVRSRKCLQRLNINTLGELASRTEAELLGIENFGQTSLVEIKKHLAEHGLNLRTLED